HRHAFFRTRTAGLADTTGAGEVDDVFLGHRAVAAGAGHVSWIHAFGDGREAGARGQGVGSGLGSRRRRSGSSRSGGGRSSSLRCFSSGGRGGSGNGAFLDDRQDLARGDGVAFLELDFLQHAINRCRHFQHDLVGFQVEQVLVTRDSVADLLVPAGDGGVGDGFGQYRYFDFGGHLADFLVADSWERRGLFGVVVVDLVDQRVG